MSEHHFIRAILIPEVARLIAGRFGISEDEALDRFYKSATAETLADEANGLYGQSALFIFGQYLEELAMERTVLETAKCQRNEFLSGSVCAIPTEETRAKAHAKTSAVCPRSVP